MKLHPALVYLALALAVPAALAGPTAPAGSAPSSTSTSSNSAHSQALAARLAVPAPTLYAANSTDKRHLFPVNDEKGLLLTCVAPEIETNKDTDVFKDCTLATGRTLDDVMHSFIGAMHEEQRKVDKAATDNSKDAAEKATQKAEER